MAEPAKPIEEPAVPNEGSDAPTDSPTPSSSDGSEETAQKKISNQLRLAGREFAARVARAAIYEHPDGIGDSREDLVREYLREVLPPRFLVTRGRIFDSEQQLSPEFDLVVAEADEVIPGMPVSGERRLVPVESVYLVAEVKSRLKKDQSNDHYEDFAKNVASLAKLRRKYVPISTADIGHAGFEEPATGNSGQIPPIMTAVVALTPVGPKTIDKHFAAHLETIPFGFWGVCCPGSHYMLRVPGKKKHWNVIEAGDAAFPHWVWTLFIRLMEDSRRVLTLRPKFSAYERSTRPEIAAIDGVKAYSLPAEQEAPAMDEKTK